MARKLHEIIDNQKKFEKIIRQWLTRDFEQQKKILIDIVVDHDKEISDALVALKKRMKGIKVKTFISLLLYKSGKNRSKTYYAFWDEQKQEVIIETYDQETRRKNEGTGFSGFKIQRNHKPV